MVRLKDISQRVGLSVMTVSKALRDEPDVSAETKTRIKLIAQQLGYLPNSAAQCLRMRRTKLLGLIIPAVTHPTFARIVLAIEERTHELGYDLLMAHTHNLIEREAACIRQFLSRRVDGLFISPAYRLESEARIYQELFARRTPTVLLSSPAPFCSQFVCVEPDELAGGHAAARHLRQLGHNRIAFLAGPPTAPWARERFEGYRRALREAGLDVDDRLVFQAGSTIEEGAKAALQMAAEKCPATAIQTVNDFVAIGCANALLGQGIHVPKDISLVGFGNTLPAEYFRVPLTTIRQPKYRLGAAAVDSMVQLLRGQRIESRRLPVELIVRESTAPPRAS